LLFGRAIAITEEASFLWDFVVALVWWIDDLFLQWFPRVGLRLVRRRLFLRFLLGLRSGWWCLRNHRWGSGRGGQQFYFGELLCRGRKRRTFGNGEEQKEDEVQQEGQEEEKDKWITLPRVGEGGCCG
jgi:hypothetical protein